MTKGETLSFPPGVIATKFICKPYAITGDVKEAYLKHHYETYPTDISFVYKPNRNPGEGPMDVFNHLRIVDVWNASRAFATDHVDYMTEDVHAVLTDGYVFCFFSYALRMNIVFFFLVVVGIVILILNLSQDEASSAIQTYLNNHYDTHVNIEGLTIGLVGSNPSHEKNFLRSIEIFEELIPDLPQVVKNAFPYFVYTCGQTEKKPNGELERKLQRDFGVYSMWCFGNRWKDVKSIEVTDSEIATFTHSLWRPQSSHASWEEPFHTITEAFHKSGQMSISEDSFIGRKLQEDIHNGTYDIEEQRRIQAERQENNLGRELTAREYERVYDFQTAVNEYVYQIWCVVQAGKIEQLNELRQAVYEHMSDMKVPVHKITL